MKAPAFRPLRLGEVRPTGWLLEQLKTQAAGLSGHLDLFWPDVRDSRWTGGTAEGWERLPYWLDGFIPLAWLLEDPALQARATRQVSYILDHQAADGWFCPDPSVDRESFDVWATFLLLKMLVVYYDATGDARIEGALERALLALDRHLDVHPLFDWGRFRWFECLIPLYWLHERTGAPWLLTFADKLRTQGFDWAAHFRDTPFTEAVAPETTSQKSHVVNNAMALKAGALMWRATGDEADRETSTAMAASLDRYHGTAVGVFTGDEHLAGLSPVRGTELCAVAEHMYSLEHLLCLTGDPRWGDQLERIAYNALPATYNPDMWTHQYDQQVNQVQCAFQEHPVFGTNGGDSNLFGLEPNYGCCTANLSQAWPKFAASLVARCVDGTRGENGLAVLAYAPCTVAVRVDGVAVQLDVETGYPFRDTVRIRVHADLPVRFPLALRIPAWADAAEIRVEGETAVSHPSAGGFARIERVWTDDTELSLRFPMEIRLTARPHGLHVVERGPLVYSLAIGERWVRVNEDVPGREPPHSDFEVLPTTPWNFALRLEPADPAAGLSFEERPVGRLPFSPEGAPVVAMALGSRVDWELVDGSAAPVPGMHRTEPGKEPLRLIPYGCTNLRLTEMPLASG